MKQLWVSMFYIYLQLNTLGNKLNQKQDTCYTSNDDVSICKNAECVAINRIQNDSKLQKMNSYTNALTNFWVNITAV